MSGATGLQPSTGVPTCMGAPESTPDALIQPNDAAGLIPDEFIPAAASESVVRHLSLPLYVPSARTTFRRW